MRGHLHKWINKNANYKPESDEDCALFEARFNPLNQYVVTTDYEGNIEDKECFKYKERYYLNSKRSVVEDYIVNVKPKKY